VLPAEGNRPAILVEQDLNTLAQEEATSAFARAEAKLFEPCWIFAVGRDPAGVGLSRRHYSNGGQGLVK
jgi:hypothetical protein